MYCGSCIRDNALARAMIALGHDVTLLPLYTPTRPDEENVSSRKIFFGGISVYLEQMAPFFRKTPRWLDALWDSTPALKLAARGSVSNQPRDLAPLTLSMLRGEHGHQQKEFAKLLDWLKTQPKPDVIVLSYTLLIALAEPLRREIGCPIVCAMQGEDLFIDGLGAFKYEAIELIQRHAGHVDAFLAVSEYYAEFMASYLGLSPQKIHVTPMGISLDGYVERARTAGADFTVGYFARVAPEKGLHLLVEAYGIMREEMGLPPSRAQAAGYLGDANYLAGIQHPEFKYHGEMSRQDKLRFLSALDVFSTPSTYAEPKGLSVLEAMAAGVPVVLPRHGAFPEMVGRTGGGLLFEPGDTRDLAAKLMQLYRDPQLRWRLGQSAASGVRKHYSAEQSARTTIEAMTHVTSLVAH